MTPLTLKELLSRIRFYLEGKSDFSTIRDWVYEFYEAEGSHILDDPLEDVFPILLAYLQFEESEKDSKRDVRMRRIHEVLNPASSSFAERTVFALEYDEIRELRKKLSDALITNETYQRKMATLSPAPYDMLRLIRWADSHRNDNDPMPERLT